MKPLLLVAIAALVLSACAPRHQPPPTTRYGYGYGYPWRGYQAPHIPDRPMYGRWGY